MTRWSAPVRYAEVDHQGVVFNAHYLTYCDEAMAAYCSDRGLRDVAERVQVVSSSLTWRAPAHWGDVLDVATRCDRIGLSSFTMHFVLSVGRRVCCEVVTTYVLVAGGHPEQLPDAVREQLS
jgi:acyl-CoA thioester hydrolase